MLLILKKVTSLLKSTKNRNANSEGKYHKLRPGDSKLRTYYGSAKLRKPLKNGLPPFRRIFSAIGFPT